MGYLKEIVIVHIQSSILFLMFTNTPLVNDFYSYLHSSGAVLTSCLPDNAFDSDGTYMSAHRSSLFLFEDNYNFICDVPVVSDLALGLSEIMNFFLVNKRLMPLGIHYI